MMWSKDNFVIARHRFTCSSFSYDLLTTHHCVGPREHVSYQRSYGDIVAELARGRDRARALACPPPSALRVCPTLSPTTTFHSIRFSLALSLSYERDTGLGFICRGLKESSMSPVLGSSSRARTGGGPHGASGKHSRSGPDSSRCVSARRPRVPFDGISFFVPQHPRSPPLHGEPHAVE
jgi:hypothetical protein